MSGELKTSQELMMSRELKRSIASHRQEMLEFARQLISIPPKIRRERVPRNAPGCCATACAA
jgi:hypothetical protein